MDMFYTCILLFPFRFDSDLSSANDSTKKEQLEKEKYEREKRMFEMEKTDLEQKYKVHVCNTIPVALLTLWHICSRNFKKAIINWKTKRVKWKPSLFAGDRPMLNQR